MILRYNNQTVFPENKNNKIKVKLFSLIVGNSVTFIITKHYSRKAGENQ